MRAKLTLIAVVIFILVPFKLMAGDAEDAVKGAEKVASAMVDGDWHVAFAAMDRKVIRKLGLDPSDLKTALDELAKQMVEVGMKIHFCTVKPPTEILELGDYKLAFLSTKMRTSFGETTVKSRGLLIAVKYKGRGIWRYVDASQMTREEIVEFYPKIPKTVQIPKVTIEIEK